MSPEEVKKHLKDELGIIFNGKLEDKEYTEAEYEKLKNDLIKYYEDYVRNVEH